MRKEKFLISIAKDDLLKVKAYCERHDICYSHVFVRGALNIIRRKR